MNLGLLLAYCRHIRRHIDVTLNIPGICRGFSFAVGSTYYFTHFIQYIHSRRLLLQNLLADLLSNTVLILIKTGVTENTQYLHSLRLYLHNLLADIIDLLGYTVLILIKTGVTKIEI